MMVVIKPLRWRINNVFLHIYEILWFPNIACGVFISSKYIVYLASVHISKCFGSMSFLNAMNIDRIFGE